MASQSSGAIYSDAWFKLAQAQVKLLPGVSVTKQVYRGQIWYVLEDKFSQRFFRVTPQSYAFLRYLESKPSVDDAWRSYLTVNPAEAPSQDEVVQLLSQLHVSNLLHFKNHADSGQIYLRSVEVSDKELRGKVLSFLYFRLPLWNPDRFLSEFDKKIANLPGWLFSVMWLAVIAWGGVSLIGQIDQLKSHTQGVFAWTNLPWLYLCMAVMKLLHEFAHGVVCKRYGGSVQTFGVMFLVTTPLPYVDTSASWTFVNKNQRILVSSAGMLADLFMAALGAVAWVNTGPGLVNSLAFNVMLIGSVSSLVFNGNPLLRFDAYYVLSDFLDIPNLYSKAQNYWYYLADKFLLGNKNAKSPVDVESEKFWLFIYAPISFFYRLLVSYAIVLFVTDLWLALGIFVFCATFYALFLKPAWTAATYLLGSRMQLYRWRALGGTFGLFAFLYVMLAVVPWPYSINAPGVVKISSLQPVYASADARVDYLLHGDGQRIEVGTKLFALNDSYYLLERSRVQAELQELGVLYRKALSSVSADVSSIKEQMDAKSSLLAEIDRRIAKLDIVADVGGRFVAVEGRDRLGMWVSQGAEMGQIIPDNSTVEFVAIISQDVAKSIFASQLDKISLRLVGQTDQTIFLHEMTLVPYKQNKLPSASLGWSGGGDVPVSREDAKGEKAVEDFFEIRAKLPRNNEDPFSYLHGLKGVLNVGLTSQTLWTRLTEGFRQLLQRRYGG